MKSLAIVFTCFFTSTAIAVKPQVPPVEVNGVAENTTRPLKRKAEKPKTEEPSQQDNTATNSDDTSGSTIDSVFKKPRTLRRSQAALNLASSSPSSTVTLSHKVTTKENRKANSTSVTPLWLNKTRALLNTPVSANIRLKSQGIFYVLEDTTTAEFAFRKSLLSCPMAEKEGAVQLFFDQPTCFTDFELLTKEPSVLSTVASLTLRKGSQNPQQVKDALHSTFSHIIKIMEAKSYAAITFDEAITFDDIKHFPSFNEINNGPKSLLAYIALYHFKNLSDHERRDDRERENLTLVNLALNTAWSGMQSQDARVRMKAKREFIRSLELACMPLILSEESVFKPIICSLFENRFFNACTKDLFFKCLSTIKNFELAYTVTALYYGDFPHSAEEVSDEFIKTSAFQNAVTGQCPRALYHQAISQGAEDEGLPQLASALRPNTRIGHIPLNQGQVVDACTHLGGLYFTHTQQFDQALIYLTYARNEVLTQLAEGESGIEFEPIIDSMIFALYNEGVESDLYPVDLKGDYDINLDMLFLQSTPPALETIESFINGLEVDQESIHDEARIYILRQWEEQRIREFNNFFGIRTTSKNDDDDDEDGVWMTNPPTLFHNSTNLLITEEAF